MHNLHCLPVNQKLTDDDEKLPVTVFNPDGKKTPLLFVRSWYTELTAYQTLAQTLGPEHPVYTVAPPQGKDRADYPVTVTEWAQWVHGQISGLKGHFIVGGNSFGGVLALHLTHELKPGDLTVAHVALIDSALPRKTHYEPKSQLHRFFYNLNKMLEVSPEERRDYIKQKWAARAKRKNRIREQSRPKDSQEKDVITSTGEKMPLLQRTIWITYLKYQPRTWDIPVSLYWTKESQEKSGDSLLGWAPWLNGPIEVYPIGGNHLNLMAAKNVTLLAERLRLLEAKVRTTALDKTTSA